MDAARDNNAKPEALSKSQLSALSKEFVPVNSSAKDAENRIVRFEKTFAQKQQKTEEQQQYYRPQFVFAPSYQQHSYFFCANSVGGASGGIWMSLSVTSSQQW
jgi:hypothetical protein